MNYGWKFDVKKFKDNLIEPKNINDMEDMHRDYILEIILLLLEWSYSYYLEYKSNTSWISKR